MIIIYQGVLVNIYLCGKRHPSLAQNPPVTSPQRPGNSLGSKDLTKRKKIRIVDGGRTSLMFDSPWVPNKTMASYR